MFLKGVFANLHVLCETDTKKTGRVAARILGGPGLYFWCPFSGLKSGEAIT